MASDRELAAWDRLGRVAAVELMQSVADLLNGAPPGGFWGRSLEVEVYVLPKAEASCREHTERLLFKHPSFELTGGACAWAEVAPSPMEGYVGLRVVVTWPRIEDCPIMKGTGKGTPLGLRGLRFSPDMLPRLEVPRSLAGPEWES